MLTTLYASALALVAQPTVPAGRASGAVATRTSDVLMINLFGNNGAQASCRLRMKPSDPYTHACSAARASNARPRASLTDHASRRVRR